MNRAIVLLSIVVVAMSSCHKEAPVIPPDQTTCDYPPGNRSFTWRTDTVAWWPSEVGGVWAFSDNDAYVMGNMHGPTVPGQTSYLGLHWDGTAWGSPGSYNDIMHLSNDVTGDDHFMVSVGYWSVGNEKVGLAEFDNQTKKWTGHQFQTPGELRAVWTDGRGYFASVGDNGMLYTKDGYGSAWVYAKLPTSFSLYRMSGVSKSEIYCLGYLSLASGITYYQIWRSVGNDWVKLSDTQDTTNQVLSLTREDDSGGDVSAVRCQMTDSLRLYVIGTQSYLFVAAKQDLSFSKTNLASLGLPLAAQGRSGLTIDTFSANDIWIVGTRYNFYQWNGTDFQKMLIPGLPNTDTQFGTQRRMIKTRSGTIFLPTEVSSQVYVVAQGTP